MARRINDEGLEVIKRFEGKRLTAYRDPVGILTIGYGHTDAAGPPQVRPGTVITEAQAEAILRQDLGQYERAVEEGVKVALSDNQFAALVSFTFNVGPANLAKSTLLKKLNAGDYDAVPGELVKWNRAGGKVLAGLTNRRAAESGLWAKGSPVSSRSVEPSKPASALAGTIVAVGTGGTLAAVAWWDRIVQFLSSLFGA